MPAHRFPILLCRDLAGTFTATLVEDNGDIAAYAPTAAEARDQLRDYLDKIYKAMPWMPAPDFLAPELSSIRVEVRPEYQSQKRRHPASQTISLQVPLVTGLSQSNLRIAAMPTLGLRFSYHSREDLKPLCVQYVQAKLRAATPAEIARFLPPSSLELDDIVVHIPRARKEKESPPQLAELNAVADAIGSRELRTRYSRAWEREQCVDRLMDALRREKSPILLVGEAGVGKTSVLADAVRKLERHRANLSPGENLVAAIFDESAVTPAVEHKHRFYLTSASRIISSMQYLGMWQQRVEDVISQLSTIGGVLCAENLLDLVRTGGRTPVDSIAAFLLPFLERSELLLITEATPAELDAVRRLLPGFADIFQIIKIPPFDRAGAVACLTKAAETQEQSYKIAVDRGVIETVHRLFSRFMPYQTFPGPAVKFISDLFERAKRNSKPIITASDAVSMFVLKTGLPELFLQDESPLNVSDIISRLDSQVIGQPAPCRAAASVVTTFKAGLNDPARPLGVLLFTGPTGVGKTQLAQSLATVLYGGDGTTSSKARLIRLDLSEYAGPDAAQRFLTSPTQTPADWIARLRQQPFSLLLLDEIEKASPEIFDILLGVFDEGRLTDAWGRVTHFNSCLIIMTSNLGAARAPFGLSRSAEPVDESQAASFFRPEFFNRIDAVIPFAPLDQSTIRAIAEKELAQLQSREGLTRRNIKLQWSPEVVSLLADEGFDARYGARPLQRALETLVVTPLSRYLVQMPHLRDTTLSLRIDSDGYLQLEPSK